MPSALSSSINALFRDIERITSQYDPSVTDEGPLAMGDIVEACHRIEGLREPDGTTLRDSQHLLSGLEKNITAKVGDVRATLASVIPSRGKALSTRHWRQLRWNVVDRPQLENEVEELRTMIALALSTLEDAVSATSFGLSQSIPSVNVLPPSEPEPLPITRRGRLRVWPSSYTPETFRRAVSASPSGLEIPRDAYVITVEPFPSRNGGYANVYRGRWNELPIALKQLRSGAIAASAVKNFFNEVQVWCRLSHPNVVPFVGTYIDSNASMFMVAPWCEHGNMLEFLQFYPQADRLQLLKQVAEGLTYLHKQKPKCIVHGDLRGANILISADHRAMLADFGLSKWVHDSGFLTEASPISAGSSISTGLQGAGATPWMAPELIDDSVERPSVTRQTDVYAMGMLIIEIYTGVPPFYGEAKRQTLAWKVVEGLRPRRPGPGAPAESRGFTDELWNLANNCWAQNPARRPAVASVAADLNAFQLSLSELHL